MRFRHEQRWQWILTMPLHCCEVIRLRLILAIDRFVSAGSADKLLVGNTASWPVWDRCRFSRRCSVPQPQNPILTYIMLCRLFFVCNCAETGKAFTRARTHTCIVVGRTYSVCELCSALSVSQHARTKTMQYIIDGILEEKHIHTRTHRHAGEQHVMNTGRSGSASAPSARAPSRE